MFVTKLVNHPLQTSTFNEKWIGRFAVCEYDSLFKLMIQFELQRRWGTWIDEATYVFLCIYCRWVSRARARFVLFLHSSCFDALGEMRFALRGNWFYAALRNYLRGFMMWALSKRGILPLQLSFTRFWVTKTHKIRCWLVLVFFLISSQYIYLE